MADRSDWRSLLRNAADIHDEAQKRRHLQASAQAADPEEARRGRYLKFLDSSFSRASTGHTAQNNLHAAAYVMGVFLTVRPYLHLRSRQLKAP